MVIFGVSLNVGIVATLIDKEQLTEGFAYTDQMRMYTSIAIFALSFILVPFLMPVIRKSVIPRMKSVDGEAITPENKELANAVGENIFLIGLLEIPMIIGLVVSLGSVVLEPVLIGTAGTLMAMVLYCGRHSASYGDSSSRV